jgi:hypothetical protein
MFSQPDADRHELQGPNDLRTLQWTAPEMTSRASASSPDMECSVPVIYKNALPENSGHRHHLSTTRGTALQRPHGPDLRTNRYHLVVRWLTHPEICQFTSDRPLIAAEGISGMKIYTMLIRHSGPSSLAGVLSDDNVRAWAKNCTSRTRTAPLGQMASFVH